MTKHKLNYCAVEFQCKGSPEDGYCKHYVVVDPYFLNLTGMPFCRFYSFGYCQNDEANAEVFKAYAKENNL